jgi:hypothetical protein
MQDEDRGRDVAAFSKHRHRKPQCFNRRLEDQDGLLGHQPTRVILKQPAFHAVLRSSYPHPGQEGSDESTQKGRNQGRKGFVQNRLRPMKAYECTSGEDPEQDESQGHTKSPAPKEGIPRTYNSIRGLAYQCDAAETRSLQLPEGSASFISLCEVAYEDTCFHSPSLHHHWVQASRHCAGFHWMEIYDATLPVYRLEVPLAYA